MRLHAILLVLLLSSQAVIAEDLDRARRMQIAVMIDQDAQQIEALIAGGADPNAPIGCGNFAPLDGAIANSNPELVQLLLSLGANPREHHIVSAARSGNLQAALKMVKLLRAAGVSVNGRDYHPKTGKYSTALHAAVLRDNVDLVRYLLTQHGLALDEANIDGDTAVLIAARNGNADIFLMLARAGAKAAPRNLIAEPFVSEGVARYADPPLH
jgi:ankyrin repeat protein